MARGNDPIIEHPSAAFATARDAIAEAVRRIRAHGRRSAILVGQGQGARGDSMRVAEVGFARDALEFGEPVQALATLAAKIDSSAFELGEGAKSVRVSNASPEAVARLVDAVFRDHFGIRPFSGERDYAFGAEWIADADAITEPRHAQVIDLASRRK